jgi:hypothetical protein
LTELHCQLGIEPAKHFFAALRVHGDEIVHQSITRFVFGITAQAETDRDDGGNDPYGQVGFADREN